MNAYGIAVDPSGDLFLANSNHHDPKHQSDGHGYPGPQTISYPPPPSPVVYVAGETVVLAATASSGLPVGYSTTGPATLSGNNGIETLRYTGTGTVTVRATQDGNGSYSAAAPITVTINVIAVPASGDTAPSVEVGSSSQAQTVTLLVSTAGTTAASIPGGLQVLTQGTPNLDFTFAAGGTCATATVYAVDQTCTVNVVFSPRATGLLRGAVVLADGSGNPLATTYLAGTGLGPQVTFTPRQSPAIGTLDSFGIALDGNGDLFVTNYSSPSVEEFTLSNGVYTQNPAPIVSGLNGPRGIVVDGAGNLFIVSINNQQIVKAVLTNGVYTLSPMPIATVSITASQAGDTLVAPAVPVTVTINVPLAQAEIGWAPSTLKIYTGTALGAGVPDATDSIPSSVAYTAALLPSGTPSAVDASTVLLPQGSYDLKATVTPTDTSNFATTAVTLLFTVRT